MAANRTGLDRREHPAVNAAQHQQYQRAMGKRLGRQGGRRQSEAYRHASGVPIKRGMKTAMATTPTANTAP